MKNMSIGVLGVRIDTVSQLEFIAHATIFLRSTDQHSIFTPNPEMLVAAYQNDIFKNILNTSSLNICDGKGLQLFLPPNTRRITGVDAMNDLCELAEGSKKKVYLLGSGETDTIRNAAAKLQKKLPRLIICGTDHGPRIQLGLDGGLRYDKNEMYETIKNIQQAKPDILFVGFGHIKQELWIAKFLHKLPSVKIAMGVGGSFDMISGKIHRAPKVFRQIGLEWLWRVARQPWRLKRIWTAVVVFPMLVWRSKYN